MIRPVVVVLTPVATIACIAVAVPLLVCVAIIAVPLLPLEAWRVRRELAEHRRAWIEKYKALPDEKRGEVGAADAYERWVKAEPGRPDALKSLVRERIPIAFRADTLLNALDAAVRRTLTALNSAGRIGVAPLVSYSYAEDLQAAKVPSQVLALAIGRINTELRSLRALDYIRFYVLPTHFKVSTPRAAGVVASLFGLDVLLWGSYIARGGETIWLNMHVRGAEPAGRDADRQGTRYQRELFPALLDIDVPVVSFDQDDHQGAYVVLLVAVIRVLERRQRRRWWSVWDNLQTTSEAVDHIVLHLVVDAFRAVPERPLDDPDGVPSAASQLVEIVGKWIGHQLHDRYGRRSDDGDVTRPGRFRQQLCAIAEKCCRMAPGAAHHWYRLGALYCIADDKERAVRAFQRAGEAETASGHIGAIGALVAAELALDDIDGARDEARALARFAAHAAGVVNSGDAYWIEQLKERKGKSAMLPILAQVRNGTPTAIAVVDQLLD